MQFSNVLNFMNDMSCENKKHWIDTERNKDIKTALQVPNMAVAELKKLNKERKFLDMSLTNSESVWFGILELIEYVEICRERGIKSPAELRAYIKP